MRVRVITPPEPILTPAEIPGDHGDDDANVAALIQAVTEEIDGPQGWLGRSLGPQTLELTSGGFCSGRNFLLPCRPIISIVSVKYLDSTGAEQTLDGGDDYGLADERLWFTNGFSFPATYCAPDAVRIRYKAGYNGATGAAAGELQTGPIPERARQAIILSVQNLLQVFGAETLRSETVEGIGSRTFLDADKTTALVRETSDRLLATLRVYL